MELMSQYDPIAQMLRRKIKILEAESKKQTAALKMAKKAHEGMKRWFDAEDNHNGTTCVKMYRTKCQKQSLQSTD